jgi:hypothetical protein
MSYMSSVGSLPTKRNASQLSTGLAGERGFFDTNASNLNIDENDHLI